MGDSSFILFCLKRWHNKVLLSAKDFWNIYLVTLPIFVSQIWGNTNLLWFFKRKKTALIWQKKIIWLRKEPCFHLTRKNVPLFNYKKTLEFNEKKKPCRDLTKKKYFFVVIDRTFLLGTKNNLQKVTMAKKKIVLKYKRWQ